MNISDAEKDAIKKALVMRATGYSVDEVSEEYVADNDLLRLSKRKTCSKYLPPDLTAIKMLLESNDDELDSLTDSELDKELERIIGQIKQLKKN